MQEESLQIRRFEDLPSASDFESLVESKNVPAVNLLFFICICLVTRDNWAVLRILNAFFFFLFSCYLILKVFSGCVKDWEACSKWNPSNGGLDYLEVFLLPLNCLCLHSFHFSWKFLLFISKTQIRNLCFFTLTNDAGVHLNKKERKQV